MSLCRSVRFRITVNKAALTGEKINIWHRLKTSLRINSVQTLTSNDNEIEECFSHRRVPVENLFGFQPSKVKDESLSKNHSVTFLKAWKPAFYASIHGAHLHKTLARRLRSLLLNTVQISPSIPYQYKHTYAHMHTRRTRFQRKTSFSLNQERKCSFLWRLFCKEKLWNAASCRRDNNSSHQELRNELCISPLTITKPKEIAHFFFFMLNIYPFHYEWMVWPAEVNIH